MKKSYAETSNETFPCIGGLTITKLVREHIALTKPRAGFGETIGGIIDAHIAQAIESGADVHEIKLEFEPDQWEQIAGRR